MSNSRTLISNKSLIDYIIKCSNFKCKKYIQPENESEEECFKELSENDTQEAKFLPSYFGEFFQKINDNYYRLGVLKELTINKNIINVSIYSSILNTLSKEYIEKTNDEKIEFISKLISKMLYDINTKSLFKKFGYRFLRWRKKQLYSAIKNVDNSDILLQFLADYFDINIFVFNVDIGCINVVYTEEKLNIFKKNIFLVNYNNTFETLYHNNNNIFDHKSYLFNYLITKKRKLLIPLDVNYLSNKVIKVFKIENYKDDKNIIDSINEACDQDIDLTDINNNEFNEMSDEGDFDDELDLNDSIDTEIDKNMKFNDLEKSTTDIFYKKEKDPENNIKITSISTKMTLVELQKIAKSLKIKLESGKFTKSGKEKMKTKSTLCNDIKKSLM